MKVASHEDCDCSETYSPILPVAGAFRHPRDDFMLDSTLPLLYSYGSSSLCDRWTFPSAREYSTLQCPHLASQRLLC